MATGMRSAQVAGATQEPPRRRPRWLVPLLAAAALVGAGVAVAALAGGEPRAPVVAIGMFDNFYAREVTRVPVGTVIAWPNQGRVAHNAFASDGSWATPEYVEPGERATVTMTEPGTVTFYCSLHGTAEGEGMSATLVVGDSPSAYASSPVDGPPAVAEASGVTRRVPADHPTIQGAVDAADPGDLVLVAPGVYREQVEVATPSITIRGEDRNATIVDGEFTRQNGIAITADGVAVENLTVRDALFNGVFWTSVRGYRASSVTSENNEVYGIYAFDSVDGLFEDSFATGSSDSGFYIGQCDPCDAVIDGVVAENNGLGYSGTNASGNLQIVNSTWRHNVGGIVPNTLDSELLPPVERVDIVGNLVHDNGSRTAPAKSIAWSTFGNGIVVAGGNGLHVARNLVVDHANHGILVTPNLDDRFWIASGNVVRGNVVRGSGRADVALTGPAGGGNCLEGNTLTTTAPPALQVTQPCSGMRLPAGLDVSTLFQSMGLIAEASRGFPVNPPRDQPAAPPQPQLPGGAGAPVRPAVDVYAAARPDLDAIEVPDAPPGLTQDQGKELAVAGVVVTATSGWQLLFQVYGYLLPFALYAAWLSLAIWDLARRDDLRRGAVLAWLAAVLVVPFVGLLAYYVAGRSPLPAWLRTAVLAGGLASYLLVIALGATLGGIV